MSYKLYDPKDSHNQKHIEGLYWKPRSRWKKNRPLCGAKCRNGSSCKAKAVVDSKTNTPTNGRCRMHGGLSTGPKTLEGKERSQKAARQGLISYWKKKKAL